jgi:hypothetical protein
MITPIQIRILLNTLDFLNNLTVRNCLNRIIFIDLVCITRWPPAPGPSLWLVIILVLTYAANSKSYVPFHPLSNVATDYFLFLAQGYFFFSSSSFRWLSSSFSANNFLSRAFSFSRSRISFRWAGVIP